MNIEELRREIKKNILESDEVNFYKNLSLLVFNKPLPEFALEWLIELPERARKEKKILVIEAPRNHIKTTCLTNFKPFWYMIQNPLSEQWLFSYSVHQSMEFIGKLKNIVEYHFPEYKNPEEWSKKALGFINGSTYKVGSISSTYYGVHPDRIIIDDILGGEGDPQKIIKSNLPPGFVEERFFSMIIPMLSPHSEMIVIGIPFYIGDIYTKMEENTNSFLTVKYPAVMDYNKKRVLWSEERDFDWLMEQKKRIGDLRFSREYMLMPFDETSSLFPSSLLFKCADYGMEIPHQRLLEESVVVIGADFSISTNPDADYTSFVALEFLDNKIYILGWDKFKDNDINSQLERLQGFYEKYRADLIVVESVSFQRIYAQELEAKMLPILSYNTHTEKNKFNVGIPSLRVYFEKNMVVIPLKGEEKEMNLDFIDEMQGFIYVNGKVLHIGKHDDMAMSFYLGIQGMRSLVSMQETTENDINIAEASIEESAVWKRL